MDKDILMPSDMFELSQTQFNFGTARSMAMAGAFTSLGADMAAMSINPAGLGMYRGNDLSFTPMMTFSKSSTKGATPYGSNSKDRFSIANVGISLNVYEGTGRLVSVNIGFGYNRIADFNYNYSFQNHGQNATIGDVFSRQLAWGGVSKNDFYSNGGSGNWNWDYGGFLWNNPQYWNAALAYRAFMVDQIDPDDPDSWQPTWVGQNASIGHYTTLNSKGSIGEFTISFGANIGNKFYVGATIGIQNIYQRKYINYAEDYRYSQPSSHHEYGTDPNLDYQLLYAKLNQTAIVEGAGVNFKVGMIYRPIENLRLGVAIHTPTYYSLDRRFQSAAAGMAFANNDTDPNVTPDPDGFISTDNDKNMVSNLLIDDGGNNWSFVSPTRLLFGASYMFGQKAIISVDYERDWYNGIRIKDNVSGLNSQRAYNDTFRDQFKGSNIVRIGAEFKPLPIFAIRAGFGYSGSMLRDDNAVLSSPAIKQTTYYTGGLGIMLSRSVSLDVAYQYATSKTTDYYLFYAEDNVGMAESARYSTEINRHNVALTLGIRF